MQKATLTDEEARQYYDAHHEEFMTPATVTLREILIAVPTELADRPGRRSTPARRRREGQGRRARAIAC